MLSKCAITLHYTSSGPWDVPVLHLPGWQQPPAYVYWRATRAAELFDTLCCTKRVHVYLAG